MRKRKFKPAKSPQEIIDDPEWIAQTSEKSLRNAQAVAKRKNRELEKKYPLFIGEIEKVTAEQVLETRRAVRADVHERFAELEQRDIERTEKAIEAVRAIVTEKAFDEIAAREESWRWGRYNYWYIAKGKIVARQTPLTDDERLILSIVREWPGEPPTHHEIFHLLKTTDHQQFLHHREIGKILESLSDKSYVRGGLLRKCTVYEGSAATWTIFIDEDQNKTFDV